MKSTGPITYDYRFVQDDGTVHVISLTRHHTGTAYARNGNVGNPTEYFTWSAKVYGDGAARPVATAEPNRREAYEKARAFILDIPYVNNERRKLYANVRDFRTVDAEMKASYAGRH